MPIRRARRARRRAAAAARRSSGAGVRQLRQRAGPAPGGPAASRITRPPSPAPRRGARPAAAAGRSAARSRRTGAGWPTARSGMLAVAQLHHQVARAAAMSLSSACASVPTSATTTPSGASRRTHSAAGCCISTSPIAASTGPRFARRLAMVANIGSADPLGPADLVAELLPELVVGDEQRQPAIRRREDLRRHDVGMRRVGQPLDGSRRR